jgi:hypothetical protein
MYRLAISWGDRFAGRAVLHEGHGVLIVGGTQFHCSTGTYAAHVTTTKAPPARYYLGHSLTVPMAVVIAPRPRGKRR